jgi:dTDP-4-dehydrorhamnose reductase
VRHAFKGNGDLKLDLTDLQSVGNTLDRVCPEAIVNLVAETNVDRCEAEPRAAYLLNVRTVENLANWVIKRNPGCRFVQLSTDQLYDGGGPHKEDRVLPGNCYALSKYAGELVALRATAVVIRTNFFGPSRTPHRASFSDWLIESMTIGAEITVFDDIKFSPLTMPRLASYIELVLQKPHPGVFNVGSHDGMTKADFAFRVADVFDLSTRKVRRGLSTQTVRAYRPHDMRMSCDRFEVTYGVRLPTLNEEIEALAKGQLND